MNIQLYIVPLSSASCATKEEFGLQCVSAGQRGPMSLDQVPGVSRMDVFGKTGKPDEFG